MDISSNQSCSFFYRKILNKYIKSRSNIFIFPTLIFKKNITNVINNKISLEFLFRLQVHNLTSALSVKNLRNMKQAPLWHNIRYILISKAKEYVSMYTYDRRKNSIPSAILWKFQKTLEKNSSQRSSLKRPVNVKEKSNDSVKETQKVEYNPSVLEQIFIPLKKIISYKNLKYTEADQLSAYNNLYYQTRWAKNYFEFIRKNIQPLLYENEPFWRNRSLSNKNMILKLHGFQINKIIRNRESTGLLLMNLRNMSISNKNIILKPHGSQIDKNFPDNEITYLPLKKFNNNVPVSVPAASIKEKNSFNLNTENFRYRDNGQITQEIENIKKIMIETKESLKSIAMRPSHHEDEKPKVDINHISDKVYQNIERSIRMERVRRGM